MKDKNHNHKPIKLKTKNLPPGTLTFTGTPKVKNVSIQVFTSFQDRIDEHSLHTMDELSQLLDPNGLHWIIITGIHKTEVIEQLGKIFKIHKLLLEDLVDVHQRPKVEFTKENVIAIFKTLEFECATDDIDYDQTSLILGNNYVITICEKPTDIFDSVKNRFKTKFGHFAERNHGYLFYALTDAIVDHYYSALELMGDEIEALDDELNKTPTKNTLAKIQKMRRNLIFMMKSILPVHEMMRMLPSYGKDIFSDEVKFYMKDLYDHSLHINENIDSLREFVSSMMDIYLSAMSNNMNEVMKVLTVVGAIFIPLTFIAGVYGMNFEFMPELRIPWAYPAVWSIMIGIAVSMIVIFKRKKWL